jgi:NAD(P)-dependent dehydrogenase (short-subunit alcohol dehydrogenase family)
MQTCLAFPGRIAIVTGGGSGFGRAFCEALAKCGATVVCVGRTEQKLKETVDIISRYGHRAIAVKADVSKADDVENMVKKESELIVLLLACI